MFYKKKNIGVLLGEKSASKTHSKKKTFLFFFEELAEISSFFLRFAEMGRKISTHFRKPGRKKTPHFPK